MPPGYHVEFGGKFQNLLEARGRLAVVVPIALFLILGLLYQTFESFRDGILIFLCIPMAVVGGVAALYIRGLPFSISAGVGFIALFGIAVLNGIVMVSAIRKHMSEGVDRMGAVKRGAHERLRPVITTASLAAFGFLPMAFSTSAGAEVQRPLATVVIGGLVSATLLTLIVLPAIYSRFGRRDDADDYMVDMGSSGTRSGVVTAILAALILLPSLATGSLQAQTVLDRETFVGRVLNHHPGIGITSETGEKRRLEAAASNELSPTRFFFEMENLGPNAEAFEPEYGLGVTQHFDFPTTYGARAGLVSEIAEANRAHVTATRRNLKIAAVRAWYELLRASAGLEVVDSSLGHARALKHIADARYGVGETGILDVHRANLALGEAIGDSLTAVVRYERSLSTVRRLAGFDASERISLDIVEPSLPGSVEVDSLARAIAGASPELKVAEAEIAVAKKRRGAVSSERLPGLQLTFVTQSKDGIDGLFGGGVGIDLPISRWLGDPATGAADALVNGAEFERSRVQLDRELAADSIARDLKASLKLLQQYETSIVPAAHATFRASVTAYRNGETGFPDVIPIHERLIEVELEYRALKLQVQRTTAYISILTER
jgi:cobalt-zinc-cadmium resistance protein CzcA